MLAASWRSPRCDTESNAIRQTVYDQVEPADAPNQFGASGSWSHSLLACAAGQPDADGARRSRPVIASMITVVHATMAKPSIYEITFA